MGDLEGIFNAAGIAYRLRGKNVGRDDINICCPFCDEVRFHCGVHKDKLFYHCFVCGASGGWYRLVARLRSKNYIISQKVGHTHSVIYADLTENKAAARDKSILYTNIPKNEKIVCNWLKTHPMPTEIKDPYRTRGFDLDILFKAGLKKGINRLDGYAVFVSGKNIIARKYDRRSIGSKWFKRNEELFLFGEEFVRMVKPEVGFITEGIFDCLRIPLGNAVALLGSLASEAIMARLIDVFSEASKLVLALDRNVNRDVVSKLKFTLEDLGYEVELLDWTRIKDKKIKDIDEYFLLNNQQKLYDFIGYEDKIIKL